MDISVYNTQQAKGTGQTASAGAGAGTGGVPGVAPGMNFMDLIFARLTAEGKNDPAKIAAGQAGAHPLLSKLAQKTDVIKSLGEGQGVTIEQILQALTQQDPAALDGIDPALLSSIDTGATIEVDSDFDPAATLKNLLDKLGSAETFPENKPLSPALKKKVTALLNSLLQGVPGDAKIVSFEIEPGKTVTEISFDKNNGETAPALIATGLSPEDLTRILKDIANGNEDGTVPAIAIVAVQNDDNTKDVVFLPRGAVAVRSQHQAGEINTPQGDQPTDKLAAQLNALTTGEAADDDGEFSLESDSDFEGVLRILQRAQTKGSETGQENKLNGIERAIDNNLGKTVSPGLSTVTLYTTGTVADSFSADSIYPDGFDFSAQPGQPMTISGASTAASLITQAQSAGMAHPATQTVAAAIAKASVNGETKNISLQLDPPELGKVHVRLEFKDNALKAHMVIEKPETYMMLQRDAHILERALQQSGMDVSSDGGLSFELAQDGNFFGNNNEGGTGGNSGGGSGGENGEGDDAEIIEVKMDWYVDPQTGLTRYDALV